MQVVAMVVFLVTWLFILWLGSIALEATGMERAKARFQALSAISGTGYTTREAESIVNHPRRRSIVSWLIFLGNAGIMSFLILLVLYLRAGLQTPTLFHIGTIVIIIVVLFLVIGLGILEKLSNTIVGFLRKGRPSSGLLTDKIFHQAGDYGVASLIVGEKSGVSGTTLKDSGFVDRDFVVLAIEREDKVLPFPKVDEKVLAGDLLLCYGKVEEITALAR